MSQAKRPANLGASVRARLLKLSRQRGVEFQLALSEFAIERLLYRLGVSPHADRFVLKGATLFRLWAVDGHRATWDLDLLGKGVSAVADMEAIVRDVCGIPCDDGIVFDLDSIVGEAIRAMDEYAGVRVRLEAMLDAARIPMQVDVGFGDAVIPPPSLESYPTLLDHGAPCILVYSREAVVAEKLEAMVSLGVTNSRMKDFYDVHRLALSFAFEGASLVRAVRATFERRGTPVHANGPLALRPGFLAAPERRTQWRAFLRRSRLDAPQDVELLAEELRAFLLPVLAAAAQGDPYEWHWLPGGPWLQAPGDETGTR